MMSGWDSRVAGSKRWVVLATLTVLLALLPAIVRGDPTWPSSTDELEEIMYQLKAFRGRRFSE
jgi:hypothetical protein